MAAAPPGGDILVDTEFCVLLLGAHVPTAGCAGHCCFCGCRLQSPLTAASAVGQFCRHVLPLLMLALAAPPGVCIVINPNHCPPSLAALAATVGRACH